MLSKLFFKILTPSWCESSKGFLPKILDEFAKSRHEWDLCLFNIEQVPKLTNKLKLMKTPNLILIYKGDTVDGVNGVPLDSDFLGLLGSLNRLRKQYVKTQEGNKVKDSALEAFESQNWLKLISWAEKAKETHGIDYNDLKMLNLMEAYAYLQTGNNKTARTKFNSLDNDYSCFEDKGRLFCEEKYTELKQSFDESLHDKDYVQAIDEYNRADSGFGKQEKLQLVNMAVEREDFELAIDVLLDIFEEDTTDTQVKGQLLSLFKQVGNQNPSVKEGRKKLATLLF